MCVRNSGRIFAIVASVYYIELHVSKRFLINMDILYRKILMAFILKGSYT